MGSWHAHALTRAGGQLIGVADSNFASAWRLAKVFRARVFGSLDEMLEQEALAVVHICTPTTTHVELAARALGAGTHVIVEKPLAPDVGSTAQLLTQAQANGLLIIPAHQFLFQPGIQAALARLGELDPPVHLEMTSVTAGANGADEVARERLVGEILPHALALFQRFLPNGLRDVEWTVCNPALGELRVLGRTQHTSLLIKLSTHGRPPRNSFEVLGVRGSIYADLFHGFAIFEKGRISRSEKVTRPFRLSARMFAASTLNLATRALHNEPAYPGLRELIRRFYTAVGRGTPAPISPDEILSIALARDWLMSASKSQGVVGEK
jgi:predicted dehydrogenase